MAILHNFAERCPGKTICRFNEVNSGGLYKQWKKDLEFATGELVRIAESEDYCDKGFLEELVAFYSDDPVLLSCAHSFFVNESSEHLPFTFENYLSQIDAHN